MQYNFHPYVLSRFVTSRTCVAAAATYPHTRSLLREDRWCGYSILIASADLSVCPTSGVTRCTESFSRSAAISPSIASASMHEMLLRTCCVYASVALDALVVAHAAPQTKAKAQASSAKPRSQPLVNDERLLILYVALEASSTLLMGTCTCVQPFTGHGRSLVTYCTHDPRFVRREPTGCSML